MSSKDQGPVYSSRRSLTRANGVTYAGYGRLLNRLEYQVVLSKQNSVPDP